jgi:hypothetical protein
MSRITKTDVQRKFDAMVSYMNMLGLDSSNLYLDAAQGYGGWRIVEKDPDRDGQQLPNSILYTERRHGQRMMAWMDGICRGLEIMSNAKMGKAVGL